MSASDLRELREGAKVSRWELSQRLPGYSNSILQRIEDGQKPMPPEFPALVLKALDEITQERRAPVLAATGGVA